MKNNFRIRLLVGCLMAWSWMRLGPFWRRYNSSTPGDPTCKLCHIEPEDAAHFILRCPALDTLCQALLADAPTKISAHFPDPITDPIRFVDVMSGFDWIPDKAIQVFIIDCLDQLRNCRNDNLIQPQ